MKLQEIISFLESIYPPSYQEDYDNSGLIVGNTNENIKKILISLDCTEKIIEESIKKRCNLIISHHPVLFKPLKNITGKTYVERTILSAIKNNVAIYAIHTNADNVLYNGVNFKIAQKLGLKNYKILSPQKNTLQKLITFCPQKNEEALRKALFDAGAGNIGEYSRCSFNSVGYGTYKPSYNANPTIGKKNKLNTEKETKIEVIFPSHIQHKIVNTLLKHHPYEEVAYDIIELQNSSTNTGAGIIGELEKPEQEIAFLKKLKKVMNLKLIKHTCLLNKPIKKVAICGGSGSFLLKKALNQNADVFISSDFKYHELFDAENKLVILDIGHYESEQFTKELFYEVIKKKFTNFAVHLSETSTNPVNYFI